MSDPLDELPPSDADPADVRALFQSRVGTPFVRAQNRSAISAASTRLRGVDKVTGASSPTDYVTVKAELQQRVIDDLQRRDLLGEGEDVVSQAVEDFVRGVLASEDLPITEAEEDHLAQELIEEALGIGPLAPLMSDPATSTAEAQHSP